MARLPYQVLVYIRRRSAPGGWEYLLLKRTAARGGFWQGVSGGLESGESALEAARREVWEETGYQRFESFVALDFRYSYPMRPEWAHLYAPDVYEIQEECFGAEVSRDEGEPALDPGEHDEYRWVDRDTALALLAWPEHQEALPRFAEMA